MHLATRQRLVGLPNIKIFGGDYNPAIVFIFRHQLIRPVPGSERDMQLGDTVLQPISLVWHNGEYHGTLSNSVWLPTGRFTAGASNNTGKGLHSHMFTASGTWIEDASLPWAVTASARFETFGKQETTGIRPGNVVTLELAGGKEAVKGLDLALRGIASFQVTQQQGSPAGTDASRYRFFSIGPGITWRPSKAPGVPHTNLDRVISVRVLVRFCLLHMRFRCGYGMSKR